MIVATTFDQKGYEIYGQRWIDSVIKYFPSTTKVILYIDFEIKNLPSNFQIISFNKNFKQYQYKLKNLLAKKFENTTEKNNIIAQKTFQFSYKGFVINNELINKRDKMFIWLDGDVETISKIDQNSIDKILDNKFLACQTEKQRYKYPHIESGILIFDTTKPEIELFQKELFNYYTTDNLYTLKKPYDGYIIGKILVDNGLSFKDFNSNILTLGKKSRKDETFLHPFLQKHFIHWIGENKTN